jgi:hypothetical protein
MITISVYDVFLYLKVYYHATDMLFGFVRLSNGLCQPVGSEKNTRIQKTAGAGCRKGV